MLAQGERAFNIDLASISAELSALVREHRDSEVPDPLLLADYVAFPGEFAALLARRGVGPAAPEGRWVFGRYDWFPYPKQPTSYRKMAVLSVTDQLAYRSLAGRIGTSSDRALPSHVYANRIERHGAGWRLRPYSQAWKGYHNFRVDSLKRNRWAYTCLTDVRAFYPTLRVDVLLSSLAGLGCGADELDALGAALTTWQSGRDGLSGLLIGGEASGVVSNPVLLPLDHFLRSLGNPARYGDDVTFFATAPPSAFLAEIDQLLGEIGLERNLGKTKEFENPVEALVAIEHQAIGSFEAWDTQDDGIAMEKLWSMWKESVLDADAPDPRVMHFVLGVLSRRGNARAAPDLAARLGLLAGDPKSTFRYLTSVAHNDQAIAEQITSYLAIPGTPTTEAFHLHALRYLASADRPTFADSPTERILDAPGGYRWPTRAWAAQAWRRAPSWRYDDAIERAWSEQSAPLRRSLVGTLRGAPDHRRVRRLALSEMRNQNEDLAPTVAWVLAA